MRGGLKIPIKPGMKPPVKAPPKPSDAGRSARRPSIKVKIDVTGWLSNKEQK